MKRMLALLLMLALIAGLMTACAGEPKETEGGSTSTMDASTSTTGTESTDTTDSTDTSDATDSSEPDMVITSIADVLAMSLEDGVETSERYYLEGTIESIVNPTYGAMNITDGTASIYVYGTYSEDGSIGYAAMESKPYKGDKVLLHCTIKNYNGTIEVHNARLISFTHIEPEVDESEYKDMSIADARKSSTGTKVKVDGVVARITYAFGMIPSGVILVDETNSIYVYDQDLAAQVQIGNKITVAAAKTYWILGDEQENAKKFGYKGCNQLESAILLENDGKTNNEFNKSWIKTTTVKEIMETPVSNDITTTIFKVNALVTKAPGNGFTNYYINDLDGKTGSYTYTQCSGSDFGWLDQFDGKICTVYLSVLNAKSTNTGCVYRFLPVAVIDEGFNVNSVNGAEYAVKYEAMDQFQTSYSGDPKLELITSVSSDLLKIKGAKLSYQSSNSSVISFTESNGKVIMNCNSSGKATITVTGSYNGKTYSEKIQINVTVAQTFDYVSVNDAIAASVGETVIVKGIVGPSLVNKDGFYLIDERGIIAVVVNNTDIFEGLKIGQEIILQGKRDLWTKDANFGQTCLTGCEVLANYYGDHDYSTSFFITDKTLADIEALDVHEDHTTSVYVVKATVKMIEDHYYTLIVLEDGAASVSLYCSSANQYNWLKAYIDQEITLELAPCNWNSKTPYKVCVLAVRTADGKIVNSLNFDN